MVVKKEMVLGCVHDYRLCVIGLILTIFCSTELYAQKEDGIVKTLVNAGFENVSRVVSGSEEIITFENTVWKADGEGISKAIDLIGKYPPLLGKTRRVVVLQLGIPQMSLVSSASAAITTTGTVNSNWLPMYELGDAWKSVKRVPRENGSRWKVDLVFYPQFAFRNQKFHKV